VRVGFSCRVWGFLRSEASSQDMFVRVVWCSCVMGGRGHMRPRRGSGRLSSPRGARGARPHRLMRPHRARRLALRGRVRRNIRDRRLFAYSYRCRFVIPLLFFLLQPPDDTHARSPTPLGEIDTMEARGNGPSYPKQCVFCLDFFCFCWIWCGGEGVWMVVDVVRPLGMPTSPLTYCRLLNKGWHGAGALPASLPGGWMGGAWGPSRRWSCAGRRRDFSRWW
jgi:hypothetical protein